MLHDINIIYDNSTNKLRLHTDLDNAKLAHCIRSILRVAIGRVDTCGDLDDLADSYVGWHNDPHIMRATYDDETGWVGYERTKDSPGADLFFALMAYYGVRTT